MPKESSAPSPRKDKSSETYARIYAVVRRIPKGRVATYGQVAKLADRPGHARQVGYALHSLNENARVPWHRVINARGECSARSEPGGEHIQKQMLEREGICFAESGRIDLGQFQWRPRVS